MRSFFLPAAPRALLLDFDSTLYTNPAFANFQNEVLIERLAHERGEGVETTRALLEGFRADQKTRGGGSTSLGNLFLLLGIPIETSVAWREELIDPRGWLSPDPALGEALDALRDRFALALVTNNPGSVGRRGLEALGVSERITSVIGLDDSLRSKPDPAPYLLAARRLGVEAAACVSIGDRYDVDLAPALSLGMGAILVDGVKDIYGLPGFLDAALTGPQSLGQYPS